MVSTPIELSRLRRIDAACDRFEAAWSEHLHSGASRSEPRIEDYLEHTDDPDSQMLLEALIALELGILEGIGVKPDRDRYSNRFGTDAAITIENAFQRHSYSAADDDDMFQPPEQIGPYRLLDRIARGGFGEVYRARHDVLDCDRAIKIFAFGGSLGRQGAREFETEARILASLRHVNIVNIHDASTTEDGYGYIVTELIDGTDLAAMMTKNRPDIETSVRIVAAIADALDYSHQIGLVHRDVKPANILLDKLGHPYLVDFGMALFGPAIEAIERQGGTPAYMSPEQARGEGHLVDGRSDVFSLGIVFYELLTGQRPFSAPHRLDVLEQIKSLEPQRLRSLNAAVPVELERICLKALSKRASDRYAQASDMASDLRCYLNRTKHSDVEAHSAANAVPSHCTIVPKGLRSFDADDSSFFPALVPGPKDQHGVPEAIRFWRSWTESSDDSTSRVGLLYGPSGSGKSSLVKAGLLPRLGDGMLPVFVEAAADETESRLLNRLRQIVPDLPREARLQAVLQHLRCHAGSAAAMKILIVLDQFEQFLQAHPHGPKHDQLVDALRQCDGQRLRCLILVRDEYWSPVSRFMRNVEVPIVDGENAAAAELFDAAHTRKVLTAFGQAYGCLPETDSEICKQQQRFIEQAVEDLTRHGRGIPVRLVLFCEMMKGRTWIPETYRAVGGADGAGVMYFEETFVSRNASPQHRMHRKAAQAVLEALLPRAECGVERPVCAVRDLRTVSGYAGKPNDFSEVIKILDQELRLITPAGCPTVSELDASAGSRYDTYYQLSHDYLTTVLRQWLDGKRRKTHRGRAQLLLEEWDRLWNPRQMPRHLPNLGDFAYVRLLTRRSTWTATQQTMMRAASRLHARRAAIALSFMLLLLFCMYFVQRRAAATTVVDHVLSMDLDSDSVAKYVDENRATLRHASQHLLDVVNDSSDRQTQVRAAFVLLLLRERRAEADNFLRPKLRQFLRPKLRQIWTDLRQADRDDVSSSNVAHVAVALARLGDWTYTWGLLQGSDNDPTLATYVIHDLAKYGCSAEPIVERLRIAMANNEPGMTMLLCEALGEFGTRLTARQREELTPLLLARYRQTDSDPGVHGSIEWLLSQWGRRAELDHIITSLRLEAATDPSSEDQWSEDQWSEDQWFVNSQGQTMVILDSQGPFMMGLSDKYPDKKWDEVEYEITINRRFAISAHEVTRQQYQVFDETRDDEQLNHFSAEPTCPMTGVRWHEAAEYCNWLSEREGIPKEEWCYRKVGEYFDKTAQGTTLRRNKYAPVRDFHRKLGYRLPTSAEWEFACKGGTTTLWNFGNDAAMLDRHGWYQVNSNLRTHPVGSLKPNRFGLFDMHGNVWEWTQTLERSQHDPKPEFDVDRTSNVSWTDHVAEILGDPMFLALAKLSSSRRGTFPSDEEPLPLKRGGAFRSELDATTSVNLSSKTKIVREPMHGFRVVRTITDYGRSADSPQPNE